MNWRGSYETSSIVLEVLLMTEPIINARVLIIDDEIITRMTLEHLLRAGKTFEPHTAANGEEGLKKAALLKPDIILLDVMMPDMDGFEVCRRLRADPQLTEIPVLMVTALDDRESRLTGLSAGADDFISKPFDSAELLIRLRTIAKLNRYRHLWHERAQLAHLIKLSPYGILLADHQGAIQLANPALAALLGADHPDELIGQSLFAYIAPEHYDHCRACFVRLAQGDFNTVHHGESVIVRSNGDRWPVAVTGSIFEWEGKTTLYLLVRDISVEKRYQRELERRAQFDTLTGLANRNLLHDRIHQALAQARRRAGLIAVLLLELDRFKVINESLGHVAGDQLLRAVAGRLVAAVADNVTVARSGGDEFTMVLPEITGLDDVRTALTRVLDALRPPFDLTNQPAFITASVGVSLYPADAEQPEALLQHAETAMYLAKQDSGHSFRFYAPTMQPQTLNRLLLENQLRQAIETGQLLLLYQPKVDALTHRVLSAEALVRWRHPERGLVSPADFIPLAEETGLILPLGEWVIREACRQLREWRETGLPTLLMGVNVSARQFREQDLVGVCRNALADSGVAAANLTLELTESMVMHDMGAVTMMLGELKALGVQLALDDFGTGYSSLSYLSRFPLDFLKIDQSFVRHLPTQARDAALARAVVGMAQGLGFRTIAEGVETAEQAQFLGQLGCNLLQGFYFSRPAPAADFAAMLRDNRVLGELS
jgi:diguanylate cyclase (GGDEF)-like protein/PAS domain S-box-containing protein